MMQQSLVDTIAHLAVRGKGILAADESSPTIGKRFQTIHVECTEEARRSYRDVLFTSPELNRYINGVILYEETLFQKTSNGMVFSEYLAKNQIIPGIKVDKGTIALAGAPHEKITQGLDGLAERLRQYREAGARFAKWRAVIGITKDDPSSYCIRANAESLARYAAICQSEGIVPIVEPEVLMDGDHSLQRCYDVTNQTLHTVFQALYDYRVQLEHIVLKPNMVVAGQAHFHQPSVEEVAEATLKVLKRNVPAAVPTINFLSGGQSDEEATAHLAAMNVASNPWVLSYSYGRALQAPALKAWAGKEEHRVAAQRALLKRARLNSAASLGQFTPRMETEE